MSVAPPRRDIHPSKKTSRTDKIISGTFGRHGLIGALSDLGHSVDPRTKAGLLNAMAMFAGKPSGENAMAAHLGHSEFRPYKVTTGGRDTHNWGPSDQWAHGGMNPSGGADIGYTANPFGFRGQHGYSLAELLGLVSSKRITHPVDPRVYLQRPYRSNKGLHN